MLDTTLKSKINQLWDKFWSGGISNPLQTMSRISHMNLMMCGINNPHIKQINTLSARYDEENHYTVVLANPPFKGSIDESEIGG
ncbi:MAG: SAM-dependent DNA methyltransferase, partial [Methanosarcinales archaeon]|nr:SAM-dependent DNA methyltransferase [Methanosarcinales archaeon]